MRLIAVPLARVRAGAPPVTTFLAQSTKKVATKSAATPNTTNGSSNGVDIKGKTPLKGDESANATKMEEIDSQKPVPLVKKLMNKASDFWVGLGREDQKSTFDWKRRTYSLGEKLMDQIEYEEWALKGVDPALGPSLDRSNDRAELQKDTSTEKSANIAKVNRLTPEAAKNVPLLFPPSMLTSTGLLSSLKKLTASRQPHHRQRLIWCVVGMPFTIPFILVPVVPNLPFFYLLWRAFSHWRAMSSSKYLSELITQGRLVPTPSEELDKILSIKASPPSSTSATNKDAIAAIEAASIEAKRQSNTSSSSSSNDATSSKEDSVTSKSEEEKIDYESYMLLKPHIIKELVKSFKLEHQLSVELTRARQQTIKSIQKGQMQKLEEAASGQIERGDNV